MGGPGRDLSHYTAPLRPCGNNTLGGSGLSLSARERENPKLVASWGVGEEEALSARNRGREQPFQRSSERKRETGDDDSPDWVMGTALLLYIWYTWGSFEC